MFKNFKKTVVVDSGINDEQIETFYWLIVKNNPDKANEALELLTQHRNDVAKKVARIFLETHLELMQEKV